MFACTLSKDRAERFDRTMPRVKIIHSKLLIFVKHDHMWVISSCCGLVRPWKRNSRALTLQYSDPIVSPKVRFQGKKWQSGYNQDLTSLLFSPLGDYLGFTPIPAHSQSAAKKCFDPRTFQADAANIDPALRQASAENLAGVEPPALDGSSSSLSNSPSPPRSEQVTTELPGHFTPPWELSWWHSFNKEKFLYYCLVPVIRVKAPGIHGFNNYNPQGLDYAYNDGKPRGEISPYFTGTMQDQITNLLRQPPPHHSFEPADYTYSDVMMGDAPYMEEPMSYQMQEYPQVNGDSDDLEPLLAAPGAPSPIHSHVFSDARVPAQATAVYRPISKKKKPSTKALSDRAKKMGELLQAGQITYNQDRYRAGEDTGVHFSDLDKMMDLREGNRENNRKNAIKWS